ncbi:MAG: hypothetical protein PHN38_09860 [Sulfurospirillaceae bacterium]|nr:hypothetical protein [Sulfurospirillaceae bacterium]
MQYVTLGIAIFGALGTIITWIHGVIVTRKKISFEIVNAVYSEKLIYAFVMLNNKSRLPIAINSISLYYNNKNIFCEKIPKKILNRTLKTGTTITSREEIKSEPFPISLNGLLGSSGYLLFFTEGYDFNKEDKVDINIFTNRGKIQLKSVNTNFIDDFQKMF